MIHSTVSCMCTTLLDNYYLSLSDYTTSYHLTITYYLLPTTYFGSNVAHVRTRLLTHGHCRTGVQAGTSFLQRMSSHPLVHYSLIQRSYSLYTWKIGALWALYTMDSHCRLRTWIATTDSGQGAKGPLSIEHIHTWTVDRGQSVHCRFKSRLSPQ